MDAAVNINLKLLSVCPVNSLTDVHKASSQATYTQKVCPGNSTSGRPGSDTES